MIKIAVCDDDILFTSFLEEIVVNLCSKMNIKVEIDVLFDGKEFIKLAQKQNYDLVYLDIEMREMNGIETAKKLRNINRNTILIYISSYENYFMQLFEVEPFRFIKKPINTKEFEKYFLQAYDRITENDIFFEYKINKTHCKVLVNDIMYFESRKRIMIINTRMGTKSYYDKMSHVEEKIEKYKVTFLRIHQSYLVNFRYIAVINFNNVELSDGTILQISEKRQKLVSKRYMGILGGDSIV